MSFYGDNELGSLLRHGESDLVERKRSIADRNAIRRNICAFANDLADTGKPGVMFFGVEDDGRCAGADIDDELLRTLAQMRGDGNILPLPIIKVEKKTIGECELAIVQVEPAENPPVRYRGRVWVRIGPDGAAGEPRGGKAPERKTAGARSDFRYASGKGRDVGRSG